MKGPICGRLEGVCEVFFLGERGDDFFTKGPGGWGDGGIVRMMGRVGGEEDYAALFDVVCEAPLGCMVVKGGEGEVDIFY